MLRPLRKHAPDETDGSADRSPAQLANEQPDQRERSARRQLTRLERLEADLVETQIALADERRKLARANARLASFDDVLEAASRALEAMARERDEIAAERARLHATLAATSEALRESQRFAEFLLARASEQR
jgi:chromosome segregation ATPase